MHRDHRVEDALLPPDSSAFRLRERDVEVEYVLTTDFDVRVSKNLVKELLSTNGPIVHVSLLWLPDKSAHANRILVSGETCRFEVERAGSPSASSCEEIASSICKHSLSLNRELYTTDLRERALSFRARQVVDGEGPLVLLPHDEGGVPGWEDFEGEAFASGIGGSYCISSCVGSHSSSALRTDSGNSTPDSDLLLPGERFEGGFAGRDDDVRVDIVEFL
jgi:hypothetical protein